MTRLATSWLVYRLTGSALLLGVVGFSGQILTFVVAPFAGVWVERMDRRKLLVWTQVAAAAQSLALAGLTLAGVITVHEIIGLSVLQGVVNGFDMPGRQAFTAQMVADKADLGNAIALSSSIVNLARLVGPALAGFVIAWVGEGQCFLIDGLSYFAVIASLLMMRLPKSSMERATASMFEQMKEGWTFVRTFRPIRTILLLFALLSLLGAPYMVLMPVFAKTVLHGGANTLGWLTGASGLGALVSAITLTLRRSVRGLLRMIAVAGAMFGGGLIALGLSQALWLSLALMAVVGFGMIQAAAACNTLVQTLSPEDKRGRVMSYYTMAFMGSAPLGSLIDGALAHRFGAPHTVMLTGAACVVAAGWYATQLPAMRAVMRPIYQEMGILPNPAETVLDDTAGRS